MLGLESSATRTCTCRWWRASTCASAPTRRARSRSRRWRRWARRTRRRWRRDSKAAGPTTCCSSASARRVFDHAPAACTHSSRFNPQQRPPGRSDYPGARVGALDAHLPVVRRAAVPDRRLPDLRRRGRLDLQRKSIDSLHARSRCDDATRLSLLGTLLDGLRITLFRRPSSPKRARARLRAGRARRAADRENPLEALSRAHARLLRPRAKGLPGRRRAATEWAYVPHFYYTPASTSTPPARSPSTSPGRAPPCAKRRWPARPRRDAYLKMLGVWQPLEVRHRSAGRSPAST